MNKKEKNILVLFEKRLSKIEKELVKQRKNNAKLLEALQKLPDCIDKTEAVEDQETFGFEQLDLFNTK